MKNIVKYSKKGLLLTIFLAMAGCSDFLEYQPYGPGGEENFWKTEADVVNVLNAFYEYTSSEECTGRGTYWYENCTDDMLTGRVYAVIDKVKSFQMGAGDHNFYNTWIHMTRVITRANDVLRNVPAMAISDELKTNATGQGHFFRGYAYLWLCPWYGDNRSGGLPIATETMTLAELDAPRPEKVTENYDMIIADLRKAGDMLPSYPDLSEKGRPHKAAAWAFAARAALYAAEYEPDKYFPVVIEMCNKIINKEDGYTERALHRLSPTHDLTDPTKNSYGLPASNFSDLFRKENNFSTEYLYSIFGSALTNGVGPKFHGMSFENAGFGGYNTWGYFTPTAELYEAFEDGDTRRAATIMAPGDKIQHPSTSGSLVGRKIWLGVPATAPERKKANNPEGEDITLGATLNTGVTFLLNRKMHSIYEAADGYGKDYHTSGNGLENGMGVVVMRYADVLLMKAEALIWTGQDLSGAKSLLDEVRDRAGLAPLTVTSQADLKTALKKERRCELVFEFLPSRHIDLVRWGDAQEAYSKPLHGYVPTFKTVGTNNWVFDFDAVKNDPTLRPQLFDARVFDPLKHHVFPIHSNIIARSKGVLKQSKGYE